MSIEIVTDSRASLWDAFVMNSSCSTFYHQYSWKSLFNSVYKLKTYYLAKIQGGNITGILPLVEFKGLRSRSLVSLPYSNYGGIVADSHSIETELISAARLILEKEQFSLLELKQNTPLIGETFETNLEYFSLSLPLNSDPDVIWRKSLNSKVRNQIRKAKKSGLTVEIGAHLWPEFLDVYRINQRDLGTPTHATSWYRKLADTYFNDMTVVVVRKGKEAIAGGWSFHFKESAILQYAASQKEYLRLCPNNLVYWEGIKHMCQRGVKHFDFARSRHNSGTFHFKQQFGANPRQTHYQYLLNTANNIPQLNQNDPALKMIIAVWKRLPIYITNIIGPHLRRRLST